MLYLHESNVGAHPLRYTTTKSVAVVGSAKSRSVWSSGWHSARGGSSYGKLSSGPEGELLTWEVILERKRETVLTTYQDRGLARLVLTSSSWTRTYAQISRYLHCAVLACCASGSTARTCPPKPQPSRVNVWAAFANRARSAARNWLRRSSMLTKLEISLLMKPKYVSSVENGNVFLGRLTVF